MHLELPIMNPFPLQNEMHLVFPAVKTRTGSLSRAVFTANHFWVCSFLSNLKESSLKSQRKDLFIWKLLFYLSLEPGALRFFSFLSRNMVNANRLPATKCSTVSQSWPQAKLQKQQTFVLSSPASLCCVLSLTLSAALPLWFHALQKTQL